MVVSPALFNLPGCAIDEVQLTASAVVLIAHTTQREIARLVGLSRGTVIQYLRAPEFPERSGRQPAPSRLDPYLPFLQQRWAEGCTNSSQLWREIVGQGSSNLPAVRAFAETQRSASDGARARSRGRLHG